MDSKSRNNKAFTLIELLVSIGILAMVMSFAGVIFKVSIGAHRTAIANAEIMQKLRAITRQLDADFKGLRKDGEIFVVWVAKLLPGDADYKDNDLDGFERFDRIMFFTDGDFQSYGIEPLTNRVVRGNLARVCYMLARNSDSRAENQERTGRVLARSQHILTADTELNDFPDVNNLGDNDTEWYQWNNHDEYDKMTLQGWKNIPWENKKDMLSVITDITVEQSTIDEDIRGLKVGSSDPNLIQNSIHLIFCEGVGEFKIQGWDQTLQRWIPEVDPDGDGDWEDDTHFYRESLLDSNNENAKAPGVLYPYRPYKSPYGGVVINNISYSVDEVDEAHFNSIPGLGRAFKFTFTLFDSNNVIKDGMTFTHIVYLDK